MAPTPPIVRGPTLGQGAPRYPVRHALPISLTVRPARWGAVECRRRENMAIAHVNGVDLYYEETGHGTPLVWSHEFGGDCRSWQPQTRYFARRYRVVTYNHRGYPPSSVPKAAADYSQGHLVEDLHQLVRHLGLGPVHLAGCSMGANMARDFALAH